MAKEPKDKVLRTESMALVGETTRAIVDCPDWVFEDANGQEHPDFITTYAKMVFNGLAGQLENVRVTVAAGVTESTKQNAVRDRLNQELGAIEPGVSLTNARIEIKGLTK